MALIRHDENLSLLDSVLLSRNCSWFDSFLLSRHCSASLSSFPLVLLPHLGYNFLMLTGSQLNAFIIIINHDPNQSSINDMIKSSSPEQPFHQSFCSSKLASSPRRGHEPGSSEWHHHQHHKSSTWEIIIITNHQHEKPSSWQTISMINHDHHKSCSSPLQLSHRWVVSSSSVFSQHRSTLPPFSSSSTPSS